MFEFMTPLLISGLIAWATNTFGGLGGALILIVLGFLALQVAYLLVWLIGSIVIILSHRFA